MTRGRSASITGALRRSLLAGLTLLWLIGVVGSGIVLDRLIDERSDDELEESGAILMSLVGMTDDLVLAAAVLGEHASAPRSSAARHGLVYQIRDPSGRVLLRSQDAPPELLGAPLREGLANASEWRVVTLGDSARGRFLQIAEPLAERRSALYTALLWLTVPLAALLAFAAFIVFRASRSLVTQVERTADAVSRQDPQALGLLPLDDVVTEMRPAVEATNRLLGRLADALESERSFTYNSAHELRTPIAGALAQAQLLAAMTKGTRAQPPVEALVGALTRLARLVERLLALARAEGLHPLVDDWVDLPTVVRLTADEFARDPRLQGRELRIQVAPARVRGDFDGVGLALRNLVENAIVHGEGATMIHLACRATNAGLILAVTDDGPGVACQQIPSLVKRFVRGAGAPGSGAGLGLSIVDTLARRMGAALEFASPPPGQRSGLEARLTWPLGRESTAYRKGGSALPAHSGGAARSHVARQS